VKNLLDFRDASNPVAGFKTKMYVVDQIAYGRRIGAVKWDSYIKAYGFVPNPTYGAYSAEMLQEMIDFITKLNNEHHE
jgi:hypothetical protein